MRSTKYNSLFMISIVLVCLTAHVNLAAVFESQWGEVNDRVWLGPEYWANPMEDWRIQDGRVECITDGPNRNVHVLVCELDSKPAEFTLSVRCGRLGSEALAGSVGFRVGITDEINDYRARCLKGKGVDIGLNHLGKLFIGNTRSSTSLEDSYQSDVVLHVTARADGTVTLEARDPDTAEVQVTVSKNVGTLQGNIALVNNHKTGKARYWFADWKLSGDQVVRHSERAWGPILWAMHTVHKTAQGHVLKMTAQMPPMGQDDPKQVRLEVKADTGWKAIGQAGIDALSCTATFRMETWSARRDVPYRLVYGDCIYKGTVRKDPEDKSELVVAGFTGNTDTGFPNNEVTRNVGVMNPDVLFFSGDQIYEGVGGYGIIRAPADRAVLNYLRKWYLFGWAFGDLMRDRVTVCLPDDHDVYQGNIWGQAGRDPGGMRGHASGGYAQDPEFVNAVHRTQCSHHPDLYDPRPVERDISVFYGSMLYGRISFAILGDRQFKSGPQGKVDTGAGRPDWVSDDTLDTSTLDKPGLELLGTRQEQFLEAWVADWSDADMKCALSQTLFVNVANYHGPKQQFIPADLDSNGWPQTPRNRALRILRKGFAFHYAGDQHLPSITHYGADTWNDAGYAFCVPSIAAGYPRSWRPDAEGRSVQNRVNGSNTGEYLDGFGNHVTVWAVGNPAAKNRKGRINMLHDKSSGFGIVRFNRPDQTITMECYRLQIDAENLKSVDQFPGWPVTVKMTENYGRKPYAYLDEVVSRGRKKPVVKVINKATGELVYALRVQGRRFRPWVFEPGVYKTEVSDPDTGNRVTVLTQTIK
ncbi:MAG: twin-arginine translocation pathway signal [Phycisphaeraceae bacterium]|nr:twin-arginine translocation pathway signal [Phycisphaeraceae bacterium]